MKEILLSILIVLVIIYVVPFIVYGAASVVTGLETPKGASPAMFLLGVLISKIGTAAAFVLIFYFAHDSLSNHWRLYAGLWWVMFALGEIGQTFGPDYSWTYATLGIISETIYLPPSAYLTNWLIKA